MAREIYISLATRRSNLINLYIPIFSTWLAQGASLSLCVYVMWLTTNFLFVSSSLFISFQIPTRPTNINCDSEKASEMEKEEGYDNTGTPSYVNESPCGSRGPAGF